MIITDLKTFNGVHCETNVAGTILNNLGINLSEAMLFGLGEGLSFIYWKMKNQEFPFIGGRVKPELLTNTLVKNLDLELEIKETRSKNKAWKNVIDYIDNGIPVGIKLDCFYLDYFPVKIHFHSHYACLYGYDDDKVYLRDTYQGDKIFTTSIESFAQARSEKGPMSSNNLSYVIKKVNDNKININQILKPILKNNAFTYLNPPIKNISFKGIEHTSKEIYKWFNSSKNLKEEFELTANLMENGGTGGSLFRNLYTEFLKECDNRLEQKNIYYSYLEFKEISEKWKAVSELFRSLSTNPNTLELNKLSLLLKDISKQEYNAMSLLIN